MTFRLNGPGGRRVWALVSCGPPLRYSGSMHRRSFLKTVPGAVGAAAMAAQQPAAGETPIKLGFDTYSLRAFNWKASQLLTYAAGLKLDTIQISSLGDYENLEPAYMQTVKDQADRLRIQIDGGA